VAAGRHPDPCVALLRDVRKVLGFVSLFFCKVATKFYGKAERKKVHFPRKRGKRAPSRVA
jgi:hypothetical protein